MKVKYGESLIIAGFAGIGKTTLAEKYKNCLDLESSLYKYKVNSTKRDDLEKGKGTIRELNDKWPQNYINAILEAKEKYDVVCVWIDPEEALVHYDENNIDYILCYPSIEAFEEYKDRYLRRGNTKEWIEKVSNYFYNKAFNQLESMNKQKIVLQRGETLESFLLNQNFNLMEKDDIHETYE